MKRGGKTLISLLCALAVAPGVRAVLNETNRVENSTTSTPADVSDSTNAPGTNEGPYSAIWLRNVFDLKPVPPPATEDPKTNAPPPNVELTGITTILGNKRALFLVTEQVPGKPPGKPESYILTEGERQGILEVLEINVKAGTVKIKNEGNISTITFTTNKTVLNAPPGAPQNGEGERERGPGRPPGYGPRGGNSGGVPMPARTMRTPDYGQPGAQNNFNGNNNFSPQGGYGQAPVAGGLSFGGSQAATTTTTPGLSLPNAFTQSSSVPQNSALEDTAPPEVTAAILAAQQAAAAQNGRFSPPIPPPLAVPGLNTPDAPGDLPTPGSPPTSAPTLPSYLQPRVSGSLGVK